LDKFYLTKSFIHKFIANSGFAKIAVQRNVDVKEKYSLFTNNNCIISFYLDKSKKSYIIQVSTLNIQLNVLVIDDNTHITDVIKSFFDSNNVNCKTVNDGTAALVEIQKPEYDLIFLDLAMPDYTGYDILNTLKRQGIINKNIVIFTASVFENIELDNFRDLNIKEVLRKPVSLNKIQEITKQVQVNIE
jgi:two-component system, OmpR family, response regulator